MAFTIPDKGEGVDNIQSVFYQEYLDAIIDGIGGKNCVLSGLAASSNSNMTVAIAKGAVLSNGTMFAVAAANATISAADAANPRIDLIVITSAGAIATRTGTPAPLASIKPATRSANDVIIAAVYVPASDTIIAANQITDLRVVREQGPILVYKTIAAETTNTTNAAINLLNKTASGVSIPNGLLQAGRILRVRLGGNALLNSGTPTVRIAIIFGGTVMFSDVSGASTNDTDRCAWSIDFDIVAQSTTDQAMVGRIHVSPLAAKTAPTTGIGDIWQAATNTTPMAGSSAVNTDTANQTLQVQWTFSVSNAANEVVTEYATVELL